VRRLAGRADYYTRVRCFPARGVMRPAVRILSMLLLLMATRPARSQSPDFEFSGYILTLPAVVRQGAASSGGEGGTSNRFVDLSRIRLRGSARFGPNTLFALEHETFIFLTGERVDAGVRDPASLRQVTRLSWTPLSGGTGRLSHTIDRLFLRHDFGMATLTVGRQRIAWGTGRVWNPTDLFNPINPADYSRIEKDGADAASLKYYAGDFSDIELVWNPGEDFRSSNYAIRARTNAFEYDVSAMAGRFDGRTVVGGDFAGNFFGAGLRGETKIATRSGGTAIPDYILGADYQFGPEVYALIEFFHQGAGSGDTASYDWSAVEAGEQLQLGRNYFYGGTTILLHPVVTANAGVNFNLDDGSGFVLPRITWSALSNLDVAAGALFTFGRDGSEYGAYERSFFGTATWYF